MKFMRRILASVLAFTILASSSIDVNAFQQLQNTQIAENQKQETNQNGKQEPRTAEEAGLTLHGEDEEETQTPITENGAMPNEAEEAGKATFTKEDDMEIEADLKRDKEEIKKPERDIDPEEVVRVIIVMDGDSIVQADKDAEVNLMTTMRSNIMVELQNVMADRIEENVLEGEALSIRYHYTWLTNGVAAEVPYGEIADIEEQPGIASVILQPVYSIDPKTVSDGGMIGREDAWNAGYTGAGTKIAVIDTGLDYDHPSFIDDPKEMTDTNVNQDDITSAIPNLHAKDLYKENVSKDLTGEEVWYSKKIPYGFNYVDNNTVIDHNSDNAGDHGTHVAGIAAANKIEGTDVVGVAPDAQLYIMKVFGYNGGAYADDLLAAVEDSLVLGADVINMSLGAPAGFTYENQELDEIYNRVKDTDTILAIAAGNSNNSADGNLWGTNANLTSNPDNGIISSPGTYGGSTTVASVDNVKTFGYYFQIGDQRMSYDQGTGNSGMSFTEYAGQDLEYVMVGNYGQTLEDFKNANVMNKVAIVQRGVSSFVDKRKLAEEAGAKACIIYNNAAGTVGMDLSESTATIPMAAVTMQAGEIFAQSSSNDDPTFHVAKEQAALPSETAYRMSDFSSWGVTPDLELKPDITAPGGNIYSTINNGKFGVMSGTSMASPNLAGCAALVKEYVRKTYPNLKDSEVHNYINSLLMSTAKPLAYDDQLPFSPRSQGAGLANAYNAVKTPGFISVEGSNLPKISLKDDPAKKGEYTYSFQVTNTSDKNVRYQMQTSVQSEGVTKDEELNANFMSMSPVALDANVKMTSDANQTYMYDFNQDGSVNTADARWLYKKIKAQTSFTGDEAMYYDVNHDEVVNEADVQAMLNDLVGLKDAKVDLSKEMLEVKPNETKTVSVTIKLNDSAKQYMDANFENGIYVEGFSTLKAVSEGGVDLSIPYMGFYGDWTQSPIFDSGFYWEDEEDQKASQQINSIYGSYGNGVQLLGINPYKDMKEEFNPDHISISPNGDGYYDKVALMELSLLRSVQNLSFTYEDVKTKEILDRDERNYVRKSFYYAAASQIVPYFYPETEDGEVYDFTDKNGEYLANNRKLNLEIKGILNYGKNAYDTWDIPITIDTEAPEITMDESPIYVDPVTQRQFITVTMKDNVNVAAMNFLNTKGTNILAQYPIDKTEIGGETKMTFEITGFGRDFLMVPGDYAGNEVVYSVHTENNDPVIDKDLLYGYRVNDKEMQDDEARYGWLAMDKENKDKTKVLSKESYIDYALNAAEYIDEYIVAVDTNDTFVWINPGYWDERKEIKKLDVMVTEMAFDPKSEKLYAYDKTNSRLITINIMTGEVTPFGEYLNGLVGMAAGKDGILYGITTEGVLKTIDTETGQWKDTLFETGNYAMYDQSMTYDEKTERIYWAYYGNNEGSGNLYSIQTKDGYAINDLGPIAGLAEVVGLLCMNDRGYQLPKKDAESIHLSKDRISMLKGDKESLDVLVTPWNAKIDDVTWSESDGDVASVDTFGNITAKGAGTTDVKAKTKDGKFEASATIHVVDPKARLNGFALSGNDLSNQWISFDADKVKKVDKDTDPASLGFAAGEYVNGTVYAYSLSSVFYRINEETKAVEKLSDNRDSTLVLDMTFDYSTGFMYALVQDLAGVSLAKVDLLTGNLDIVGSAMDRYGSAGCAMTSDGKGSIFVMAQNGILYTYDVTTTEMKQVGMSGYAGSPMLQSMTYDYDTNEIYWAMMASNGLAMLMYVDPTTGQALPLGAINGGAEVTAMYAKPEKDMEIPYVPVENIKLKNESAKILAGGTTGISIDVQPWNATVKDVKWTVVDSNIAVIENGVLKAKAAGNTIATGVLTDEQNNNKTHTVTLNIQVIPSAGSLRGYVLHDIETQAGKFWSEIKDYDLSKGEALAATEDVEVYAGEYYDGKIYTYGVNSESMQKQFMIFDEKTFKYEVITGDFVDIQDMAFDYSQGAMYGIGTLFNSETNSTLYAIDTNTGKTFDLFSLNAKIKALACSTDGQLYGMSGEGFLYKINKLTGELTKMGETGLQVNQYQSMAFDHKTGNLYWAYMYSDPLGETKSGLRLVNPENAELINLGLIGAGGCQYTAMYTIPDASLKPTQGDITSVILDQKKQLMKQGETIQLQGAALPINVIHNESVTYMSLNTNIAAVTSDGKVTAVAPGKTTIRATSSNGKSADCVINVMNPANQFYAFNNNGWQISSIDDTLKSQRTELAPTAGFEINDTIRKNNDFYTIDNKNNLWKFNEGQTEFKNIGNIKDKIEYDKALYKDVKIVNMTLNTFNDTAYILVALNEGWSFVYAVYTLDLSTGSTEFKSLDNGHYLASIISCSFVRENELFAYDYMDQSIKALNIDTGESRKINWAQNSIDSSENGAMLYSREFDTVFYASSGYNTSKVTIYTIDPQTGVIKIFSKTDFASDIQALVLK